MQSNISSIEAPSTMSGNTLNRPAQASQSLYPLCRDLLGRLYCVEGFEQYLLQGQSIVPSNGSIVGTPTSENGPSSLVLKYDPVTLLWQTFRLGYPLCALFNALKPQKPLKIDDSKPGNTNKSKASVYNFLVACREEFELKPEQMFSITQLYQDDTNGLLNLSRKKDLGRSDPMKPTDNRARVVHELLETERKYVQDMEELIKFTDKEDIHYEEIKCGLNAIKRVADRVNETRRQQENAAVVKDLERRVEDWKGHRIEQFGELLLEDVFTMSKDDSEREYHVYLFEKILLCCKETNAKKQQSDSEMESFSLKCRNEEQLKQWKSTLEKLLTDSGNNNNRHTLTKGQFDNNATTPSKRTGLKSQSLPYGQLPSSYNEKGRPKTNDSVAPPPYAWDPNSPPIPPVMPNSHLQHRSQSSSSLQTMARNGLSTAPPTMATFPSNAIMQMENTGYYPNSPPPSYPGSPAPSTRSSATSHSSTNHMSIWQRRSVEHPSPLAGTIAKFMMNEDEENNNIPPPPIQRSHSHSAAAGQTFQQTNGPVPN
ncbi:15193_t:CDS:2, partial [Racocetra fulgida]